MQAEDFACLERGMGLVHLTPSLVFVAVLKDELSNEAHMI